jgi:hypothetical protein
MSCMSDTSDWAGRHRGLLRAAAVAMGAVGVFLNVFHEGMRGNVITHVIGVGMLVGAYWAWNAPKAIPRPPKYPENFLSNQ